jgi:hypothetical protein
MLITRYGVILVKYFVTNGFKVLWIGIWCYLPENTYIYIYSSFSKIHLAVPACCTGIHIYKNGL